MIKETTDQLLKRLPKNYRKINYLTYIDVIKLYAEVMPEGTDEDQYQAYLSYSTLAILLDLPVSDIAKLPAYDIMLLFKPLEYLNLPIHEVGCNLELKSIEEITYDEYLTYNRLVNDHWHNMPEILHMFIKGKSKDEISNLSIWEVQQAIYALKKKLKKSLRTFQFSLAVKTLKLLMKEKMNKLLNRGQQSLVI